MKVHSQRVLYETHSFKLNGSAFSTSFFRVAICCVTSSPKDYNDSKIINLCCMWRSGCDIGFFFFTMDFILIIDPIQQTLRV